MSLLDRAIRSLNYSAVWRHSVRVGPDRLHAPSLDRLVYLWLHKLRYRRNGDLAFLRQCLRPGMHVVDVGANVGLYSHLFAWAVGPGGRVTAFEPDPVLCAAAETSIRANRLSNITVHRIALGDKPGCGHLNRGFFNSGDNRLMADGQGPVEANAIDAQVCALDDVLDDGPVDFVKIDVQGGEVNVLRGMAKTIEANPRLQLFVELWPFGLRAAGTSTQELFDLVAAYGFKADLVGHSGRSDTIDFEAMSKRMYWSTDIHASRR